MHPVISLDFDTSTYIHTSQLSLVYTRFKCASVIVQSVVKFRLILL